MTLLLSISGCSNFPERIKKIAVDTTVFINARGTGTGVIIAQKGNKYYVLTSRHVVGIPPGPIDDKYTLKTFDGIEYLIEYKKVKPDQNLDLAIVEFNANGRTYKTATLSKALKKDSSVYISGWRDCSTPKYEFNKGKVSEIVSYISALPKGSKLEEYNKKDIKEGYKVKYTNITIRGMSGAPVFNDTGNVVAIHGKPGHYKGTLYNFEACNELNDDFANNWGIPIEDFFKSSLASGIKDIKLNIAD
ncbi:serine protease [Nostoc sp. ATCC 53789]|uniref:S1 family peptidase n=1 Tax=Nostoc sp. ATCC 53789 TaxID=76335 RepID=UPI00133141B3|nr:serine protease [Nostoc sp. ATCC 53789]